ncbi:hypothetical protein [Paenibacillus sp. GCM10027626]|uniref:hypothetical protein n=1 Tax=Paenibacillus sp. GCM10027626 TaxID=3273411 RepID=UPI00362A4211
MPLLIPKSLQQFPIGEIRDPLIAKSFPAAGLEELRIDVQTLGNVLIRFDAETDVSVTAAGEGHLLPQRVEREGNTLVVEGRNLGSYFRSGQKLKILIEIRVPEHTKVNISFWAGVVILSGGTGEVNIRGKFGEVSGITHSERVTIRLRGGDVSLNELHGTADIHVSLGSATLGWTELRGTERIKVHCGFGGVDLLLPPGISPVEDQGGFFKLKKVASPEGSSIEAKIGFGGLDVLDWGIERDK